VERVKGIKLSTESKSQLISGSDSANQLISPLLNESHVVLVSWLLRVSFSLLLILHLTFGSNFKDKTPVSPLAESCLGVNSCVIQIKL